MFKAPEWEDDVPNTLTSFIKKNEKINKKPEPQNKTAKNVNKINGNKSADTTTANVHTAKLIKDKKPNEKQHNQNNTHKNSDNTRKRKFEKTLATKKKKNNIEDDLTVDVNPETQNYDEIILNAKKKKLYEEILNDDREDLLFAEDTPTENKNKNTKSKVKKPEVESEDENQGGLYFSENANKKKKKKKNERNNNNTEKQHDIVSGLVNTKKDKLKAILEIQSNRNHINVANKGSQLRERMLERLKAAQFRYLNEKLYTSSGSDAQKLFQEDPSAFETYHQGYQLQVKKWPVNPLDVIVKKIMKMPKTHLIADMGCGEAALSRRVPHTVRSFDLVARAPGVEACDMARTPLLTSSVDVAVYCLALMGTDLTQYLVEANRVMKMGGHLLIAEVESRFDNVENFAKEVQRLGFKLKQLDKSNKVFFFLEFTKTGDPPVKKAKLPALTLKPCLYKRR